MDLIGAPPPVPPWSEQAAKLERQIDHLGGVVVGLRRELADLDAVLRWLAIILGLETLVVVAMGAALLWHLGTT